MTDEISGIVEGGVVTTFWCEGTFFGIPIEQTQEITSHSELTPVWRTDPACVGLTNLRGQVLVAVSLATRLTGKTRRLNEEGVSVEKFQIIVNIHNVRTCLLVEEVGSTVDLKDFKKINTDSANTQLQLGLYANFVKEVYLLENDLLLILDLAKVLDFKNNDKQRKAQIC